MTAEPTLTDLEILARQAGAMLIVGFGQRHQVRRKGTYIDLVTEVDTATEAFLIAQIRSRFPDHHLVAEETGVHPGTAAGPRWYIDPLDGTVNYAHGMPYFSVSLAYADASGLRYAAVYDPWRDECFCAARGQGAWLNGRRLTVSRRENLADSLLITGFPYDRWTNPDNNVNHFTHFLLRSSGVLRLGSAALDLAYVAAGRADGFWELRLKPWDVAAGALLVREAGGVVTDPTGAALNLDQTAISVVAANPELHAAMLEVLALSARSQPQPREESHGR
ncbi:MAG: inositol monophosphatase [Chloroflexi bacterium]|nr:inositol monophosphatase [Chloroflexota bacterium]